MFTNGLAEGITPLEEMSTAQNSRENSKRKHRKLKDQVKCRTLLGNELKLSKVHSDNPNL